MGSGVSKGLGLYCVRKALVLPNKLASPNPEIRGWRQRIVRVFLFYCRALVPYSYSSMIALDYDFSCSLLTKRQIIMVDPWLGLTREPAVGTREGSDGF